MVLGFGWLMQFDPNIHWSLGTVAKRKVLKVTTTENAQIVYLEMRAWVRAWKKTLADVILAYLDRSEGAKKHKVTMKDVLDEDSKPPPLQKNPDDVYNEENSYPDEEIVKERWIKIEIPQITKGETLCSFTPGESTLCIYSDEDTPLSLSKE